MNVRDYHGAQLSFDDLPADVKPRAIQSVLEIDNAHHKRTIAAEIAAYKALPLNARINSRFISKLYRREVRYKTHLVRVNSSSDEAAKFIRENVCMFTTDGVYLTFCH